MSRAKLLIASEQSVWLKFNEQKNELLAKLKARSYAKDIIVFGSLARGKEFPGDIDVYLDQSTQSMDEFIYSKTASELLWFSQKFYGSFDPFVLVSKGFIDGKAETLLITRNDYGTGWIKAKQARKILGDIQAQGVPLATIGVLKTAKEGENEDGYWAGENNGASGILPIARDTKRICLAWRNAETHTGDCWGTIGGAVKDDLTPEASAKAEMKEEVGYAGGVEMHAGWVFKDGDFAYHNYVGVVDHEFKFNPGSEHAWETDRITWETFDDIQQDMKSNPGDYHPEFINFFKNSHELIAGLVGEEKAKKASPDFGYSQYNDREKDLKQVRLVANGGEERFDVNCYFGEVSDDNRIGGGACVRTRLRREKAYQVSIVKINPAWRGTGLGQMLYDKLIEQARKRRARWLISDDMMSDDATNAWNRLSTRYPVDFSTKQFVLDLAPAAAKVADQQYEEWIGVDLDGTLAKNYEGPFDPLKIGDPVQLMVEKILFALADGKTVKVFTARMADKEKAEKIREVIGDYTEKHIGTRLDATNEKDPGCTEIWDDKARQVIEDTGVIVKAAGSHYPATPEWIDKAKAFLWEKWRERATEMGRPEPTDLNTACKFASLFAQNLFGGEVRGNREHQFLDTDEGIRVDLTDNLTAPAHHDKRFWLNPEHRESMQSIEPRVRKWVEEFRQRSSTTKTASPEAPDIELQNDCFDSHGGEVFCKLQAVENGDKTVGYVDYSLYEDEIHIKMIRVVEDSRRKGIATELLDRLRKDNPGYALNWGMMTDEGAALKAKVHQPQDEPPNRMLQELEASREDFVREAQEQYNDWPVPQFNNEPGEGGLAEQIADTLEWAVKHYTFGYGEVHQQGDDYVIDCSSSRGSARLSIPSGVFEERVGEQWRRKEGVTIQPQDIKIVAPSVKQSGNNKNPPGKAENTTYPEYSNGWALFPDQRGEEENVDVSKMIQPLV